MNEQGERLNRDSQVTMHAVPLAREAVQPPHQRRLAPIGVVRLQKRGDRCLGHQRLWLIPRVSKIIELREEPGIEIDCETMLHS